MHRDGMRHEERDVIAALAERRPADDEAVEPREQIRKQFSLPGADGSELWSLGWFEAAVLDDRRRLADLVEEERAPYAEMK